MDIFTLVMLVACTTTAISFFAIVLDDLSETVEKIFKIFIWIGLIVIAAGLTKLAYDHMTAPTIYVTPSGQFINADSLKEVKPVVK